MIFFLALQKCSLLNHALTSSLLRLFPEHRVVTSTSCNLDTLITEISNLMPDVIFLGETTPLAAKDVLANLLMGFPEMRVIVVSEDSNWLHIFHKKDLMLTQVSDLLNIIQPQ